MMLKNPAINPPTESSCSMKTALHALTFAAALLGSAPAAVTLSFNTTTDGFTVAGGGVNAVAWDAANGGRLAVTTGPGFNMQVAKLDLNNPAVAAEFQNAKLYGGTITYSVSVEAGSVVGGTPGWFEGSFLANSGNFIGAGDPGNTNVYDQNFNIAGGNFSIGTWPITTPVTANLSYNIALSPTGVSANDANAQFVTGPTNYNELYLGLNSGDGTAFTTATYYVDNFTITANPAPEPGAPSLGLLAAGALLARRRR